MTTLLRCSFILSVALFALHVSPACALRFRLEDREKRCFTFTVSYNTPIRGSLSVLNGVGEVRLALTVKDSAGSTLLDTTRGNADKGAKFSFAAPNSYRAGDVEDAYEYDDFEPSGTLSACLILTFDDAVHRPGVKRAVLFSIQPQSKLGVDTEGPPAKEGGVMAVARQMEQMEGTLNDMVGDLVALQQRERRLVKKTEATGGRLLVLSVVSYIILVAVATTQIQHYRSFFKAKKLL